MRRTRSSSGSPACWRNRRSSPASSPKRATASGEYAAAPGSSSASASAGISVGSDPATASASSSSTDRSRARSCGPRTFVSSRARAPSRARSRGPTAHRGLVSSVSSEALSDRSCSRVRVATTSLTSGSPSSPLRPTISTGTSASDSAPKTRAAYLLSRTSTATSFQARSPPPGLVRSRAARTAPGNQASSCSSYAKTSAWRSPSGASGGGSRGSTCRSTGAIGSGMAATMRLASSRMREPERRLTVRECCVTAVEPSAAGKLSPNRMMFDTDAPRQP